MTDWGANRFRIESGFALSIGTRSGRFELWIKRCMRRATASGVSLLAAVSDDDAKQRFGDFEVVLPYFRKTKQPGA